MFDLPNIICFLNELYRSKPQHIINMYFVCKMIRTKRKKKAKYYLVKINIDMTNPMLYTIYWCVSRVINKILNKMCGFLKWSSYHLKIQFGVQLCSDSISSPVCCLLVTREDDITGFLYRTVSWMKPLQTKHRYYSSQSGLIHKCLSATCARKENRSNQK